MAVAAVGEAELERIGRSFVDALAARDFDGLRDLVARDVRFRLLVPKGPQAQAGVEETVDRFVGWFSGVDELTLESSNVGTAAGRLVFTYRFRLHDADGPQLIEQHVVADVGPDGRVEAIDLLCTGFRPLPVEGTGAVHAFDAGSRGCAGGLAAEFRRRIGRVPVGDVLLVTVRDASAKEDLPALARMMGHAVRSVEAPGDGRLLIEVERRR